MTHTNPLPVHGSVIITDTGAEVYCGQCHRWKPLPIEDPIDPELVLATHVQDEHPDSPSTAL